MGLNTSFHVLAVELDSGTLFLSDRRATLGDDRLIPALLSQGDVSSEGCALSLEAQALPPEVTGQFWTNREAAILECRPDMGSVYDGSILFDGVIASEPDSEAGVLNLRLIPPRRRVVNVPDDGLVTADRWPLAAASAMGQSLPMIFGTVEDCPLLPVRLPPATTLSTDASIGDGQLEVDDASAFPASGTVHVDGHAYSYESRSTAGNTLLGMTITSTHRQGTAVVLAGDTVFRAAGHPLAALTSIRSGALLPGASISLTDAEATFAMPPLIVERAERYSLIAQFDQISAGNTALNAVNAIRAVTSSLSQSASSLPSGITAASEDAAIVFPRPAGRIVKGAYTVAFTVTIGAQVGWARVKIGNEVVWMLEPPASVLYNWTPATITFDSDTDSLPVVVEVEDGGSVDQVSVSITSASRVIGLGNLDDANFATLRSPSNLLWRGDQTDALPDRGPIASAKLWVRWFVNGDAALPSPSVKFAGRTLGKLEQTQLSGGSVNQTVSVDVLSQGVAALPQQNISTVVSGGTASLSHNSIPQTITLPAAFSYPFVTGNIYFRRGFSIVPPLTGWDSGQGAITVKLQVQAELGTPNDQLKWLEVRRANGTIISQITASGTGWVNIATNVYEKTVTISEAPASLYWFETNTGDGQSLVSVSFSYNARTTSTAVAQANTPAAGYSNPLGAQSLSHSGISLRTNNGNISLTVPAPPRVIDTLFDLSLVREWGALTGQAEISYASGGPDLCINQVALIVEYDAPVYARAESVTATVTGLSGNPADVIETLAGKTGQRCDGPSLARLRAWCGANDYRYGRRIGETTDSLQALAFALDQLNAMAGQVDGRLAPVRRLDLGRSPFVIHEVDLLDPVRISWAETTDNDITLRYAANADGDFARALAANADNNAYCKRSLAALREKHSVTIEAGWLREDATAARYLADLTRLTARPRRVLTLACTFDVTAGVGDLIAFYPLHAQAGEQITARITARTTDDGWPSITAEQLID